MKLILWLFIALLLLQPLFAYQVVLKDGKAVRGTLVSQGQSSVILKDTNGVILNFKKADIDQEKTEAANKKGDPPPVPQLKEQKAPPAQTQGSAKKPARVLSVQDLPQLREKYDLGLKSFGESQKVDLGKITAAETKSHSSELSDFDRQVLDSDIPVLVDFWASWCGPCKMIAPIIEEVSSDFAGRAKVFRVNIDKQKATAQRFEIEAIPTLLFFKDGQQVDRIVGAAPKKLITEKLQALTD